MKKAILSIALFAVFLVSTAAFTERVFEADNGYKAPLFTVENAAAGTTLSLADLKGRYVLLTFWSSTSVDSRLQCRDYQSIAETMGADKIDHLAVNFDSSEGVFREIVRRDGLQASSQYHVSGELASRISENYHLDGGYSTFLIDPSGEIIAVNPSASTIKELIG